MKYGANAIRVSRAGIDQQPQYTVGTAPEAERKTVMHLALQKLSSLSIIFQLNIYQDENREQGHSILRDTKAIDE